MHLDIIIKNGRYFDGLNNPSRVCNIGIKDGRVADIADIPMIPGPDTIVIEARDHWVLPGFVDIHTHYDIEVLVNPSLNESVRHGVTTVITGNCSLSAVFSSALDCADMFSRVEALPREPVLSILETHKTWNNPHGLINKLRSLPLGPNIAAILGHSDLRAYVLGLKDAVNRRYRPRKDQLKLMQNLLADALSEGFLGLSTMTNTWDKLDGDRFLSASLPSTYATFKESRYLNDVLRTSGKILQSVPNLNTKINFIRFFLASMPLPWRASLKTSLLSATDLKSSLWLASVIGPGTRLLNGMLRAKIMWQALPLPFEVYADGMELVVFEEFGAGRDALHIRDEIERNELLQQKDYRRKFRADFDARFSPRIWHRDLHDAHIVACPDRNLVGRSFGDIADEKKLHPADVFLDLMIAYGSKIRWKTTIANHREHIAEQLLRQPNVLIGFADSGAHLRNMGFYNFPLHLLKKAQDAERAGRNFISLERAVYKLTKEPADWFGIDAGSLCVGDRADVTVIDPRELDDSLAQYHEEEFLEMAQVKRIVRRNDKAVPAVIINGKLAYSEGKRSFLFGREAFGQFLPAISRVSVT